MAVGDSLHSPAATKLPLGFVGTTAWSMFSTSIYAERVKLLYRDPRWLAAQQDLIR